MAIFSTTDQLFEQTCQWNSPLDEALECKTCRKTDPDCILGYTATVRYCADENDLCYAWFDRTGKERGALFSFSPFLSLSLGGVVGVQRDCLSTRMSEYAVIQEMIGYQESGCVKRMNGLDCFRFCSEDRCN